MYKAFIPFILLLTSTNVIAQPLSYDKYRLTYFEDFTDYSSPGSDKDAFKRNPLFKKLWHTENGDWGHGNEKYIPQNVIMPDYGIIRLLQTPAPEPYDSITRNDERKAVLYHAGYMRINADYNTKERNFGYGIVEASIRFPAEVPEGQRATEISFWLWGHKSTEIDVFDVSFTNYFSTRGWDWNKPKTIWKTELMHPIDNPMIPRIDDGEFHVFSAEWTPSVVRYYIDGVFLNSFYYTDIRTHPFFYNIEIAIMPTGENYYPNQYMEIDWIKQWKRTCMQDTFTYNGDEYSPFSYKVPASGRHFYYENVTIKSNKTITPPTDVPTLIEGDNTTINRNLLVDQSKRIEHYSTIDNDERKSDSEPRFKQYKQLGNAYFEINSKECK